LQFIGGFESHSLHHIFNGGSSPGTQHAAYVWNWRAWGQGYKVWRGRKPADQGGVHLLPCGYSYCFELSGELLQHCPVLRRQAFRKMSATTLSPVDLETTAKRVQLLPRVLLYVIPNPSGANERHPGWIFLIHFPQKSGVTGLSCATSPSLPAKRAQLKAQPRLLESIRRLLAIMLSSC